MQDEQKVKKGELYIRFIDGRVVSYNLVINKKTTLNFNKISNEFSFINNNQKLLPYNNDKCISFHHYFKQFCTKVEK